MEEVFPEVAFWIFGIPVRDTVVSTWFTMAVILGGVVMFRMTRPSALEMLVEFFRSTVADVMTGVNVDPYIPYLGTLGLFLAVANNIGVVPWVCTPTRDINTPIALAVTVLIAVHIFGVQKKGLWPYLREQASPMIVLDIVGQASRTMSLSLRLFGNIIAGEIIVAVIYRLVKPIAPLPLIVLSLVTGVLQAYIFMVLATSAISTAVRTKDTAGAS